MIDSDIFFDSPDKELDLDITAQVNQGNLTPPIIQSPRTPVSNTFSNFSADKVHQKHTQIIPKSPSNEDHPLRRENENVAFGRRRPNANLNKRKSLIQPIVAPSTPEHKPNLLIGSHFNNSAPPTLNPVKSKETLLMKTSIDRSSRRTSVCSNRDGFEDISLVLQKMAKKELELLEGKQRIEELKKQLALEEKEHKQGLQELERLKDFVGSQYQYNNNNLLESPSSMRPTKDTTNMSKEGTQKGAEKEFDHASNSVWSKPLALINQVDQVIQHELERSLNWDEPTAQVNRNKESSNNQRDQKSRGVRQKKTEERSVTQSIWNFVNDMKTGLLGVEDTENTQNAGGRKTSAVTGERNTQSVNIHDPRTISEFKDATSMNFDEDIKWQRKNNLRFVGSDDHQQSNESETPTKGVQMTDL